VSNLAQVKSQTFRSLFTIVPEKGCWRATRADGLVSGLFFERDAAVRFARHAALYHSAAVVAEVK
jgi:hypothetical protein